MLLKVVIVAFVTTCINNAAYQRGPYLFNFLTSNAVLYLFSTQTEQEYHKYV